MDSITHLFFGGVIAAAIALKQHRRAALLAGMALNTLPDLDVFPLMLSDDPVDAHDLAPCRHAFVAGAAVRRVGDLVVLQAARKARRAIADALVVGDLRLPDGAPAAGQLHRLRHATAVALPIPPMMWSSLFIIDPLFTLPWFVAFVLAMVAGSKSWGGRALAAGIVFGVGYVVWSLVAKSMVERRRIARSLPSDWPTHRGSRCRNRSTRCCGGWWR